MIYLINENYCHKDHEKKNAGFKAKVDIDTILGSNDNFQIEVVNFMFSVKRNKNVFEKIINNINKLIEWKKQIDAKNFKQGDVIFFQYPMVNLPYGFHLLLKSLKTKKIITVAIIHDLESVRTPFLKIAMKEIPVLNTLNYLIDHNSKMRGKLADMGINNPKVVDLGLFDYIIGDGVIDCRNVSNDEIIIAGNLAREKAGYIYELPDKTKFGLYGVGCDGKIKNANYYGAFASELIPFKIKGRFGLVWDGPSSKTCEGNYGNYMRINNPHKTSLYLSAGIPVIVWNESAIADFVVENRCGITVSSLDEIYDKLQSINSTQYADLVNNAQLISEKVRTGYYITSAVKKILDDIECQDIYDSCVE